MFNIIYKITVYQLYQNQLVGVQNCMRHYNLSPFLRDRKFECLHNLLHYVMWKKITNNNIPPDKNKVLPEKRVPGVLLP